MISEACHNTLFLKLARQYVENLGNLTRNERVYLDLK